MLVTLAGAMSTAELGRSLAEMIRRGKVHAICSTGANLEEDLFNLVAHDHYVRLPNYRELSAREEKELEQRGLNRVTDTCIPEVEAFRAIEKPILELWRRAEAAGRRHLPYEYLYQLIREGWVREHYQIDPALSWLVAAAEADLPIFVPGWEDSTLGNIFVSHVLSGDLKSYGTVKSGLRVITSPMGRLRLFSKRRSRLVRMPASRPSLLPSSVIGTPEMRYCCIRSSASASVLVAASVIGLTIIPLSERFTRSTSAACSSIDRFL